MTVACEKQQVEPAFERVDCLARLPDGPRVRQKMGGELASRSLWKTQNGEVSLARARTGWENVLFQMQIDSGRSLAFPV